MRCLMGVALLVGCEVTYTEPTKVDVQCETTREGVECTAKHVFGNAEGESCWDVVITCGNGFVIKAPHMCTKVKPGGTSSAVESIAPEKIEKCTGGRPTLVVENPTIDGKAGLPVPVTKEDR